MPDSVLTWLKAMVDALIASDQALASVHSDTSMILGRTSRCAFILVVLLFKLYKAENTGAQVGRKKEGADKYDLPARQDNPLPLDFVEGLALPKGTTAGTLTIASLGKHICTVRTTHDLELHL